ncbi:MAG TPA: hypothetical protein DGG95_16140 [Cytophagales bacterium]|jgi:ligand-binding SRPBCC domain-containing protein|nr:hypothetical protein [Cytophagales bacterium]
MKVYHFKQSQFIQAKIDIVWEFFSTPKNLNEITPRDMNFEILHITGGEKMYSGQLISYKVSPFPLLRMRWVTEIKNVETKKYFIDEQRIGPFAFWHHQHFFVEQGAGVLMTDEVSYAIPFGMFGRMANWIVQNQLKAIFKFREEKIKFIFPFN